MKRTILLFSFFLICSLFTSGQTPADSITMKKTFGGYLYFHQDHRLNLPGMVRILQPNEQAYKEIKAAQATYAFSAVVGGVSGFMLGWTLGTALGGGEPDPVVAGIGAGLLVVYIPLLQKFNKQVKTAVETYNGGIKTSSRLEKIEVKMAFTGNGLSLVARF